MSTCAKCGKKIEAHEVLVWENNISYHGDCWLEKYQARRVQR
jgi:hypothetical protein